MADLAQYEQELAGSSGVSSLAFGVCAGAMVPRAALAFPP
jgi:hypothetical protein